MVPHQSRGPVAEARRAAVGREDLGLCSVLRPEVVAQREGALPVGPRVLTA